MVKPRNHIHLVSVLVLTAPLGACDPMEPNALESPSHPTDVNRDTSIHFDCAGSPLPVCEAGWAGAGCSHPCSEGFDTCTIDHYCHADGRIRGLTASGTALFTLPSIDPSPQEVSAALEAWIVQHTDDLDLVDGLTANLLRIEPLAERRLRQGRLSVYRFFQYADAAGHPALVVGDGSILTVEAGPQGVHAVKGTIVDPRLPFAHAAFPASEQAGRRAIQFHVHQRLGVPESSVTVHDLALVAVPGPGVIAWQGVAVINGQVPVATVIVEADPEAARSRLPLVGYDDHTANGLHDAVGVQVVSEDLGTDICTAPVSEAVVASLLDGSDLPGSIDDISGLAQLASPGVVALDLQGHSLATVTDPAHVSRYVDAGADFDATQPNAGFDAQRHYHLSQESYALVDRVAAGSWDSALPLYLGLVPDPMDPTQSIAVPKSSDYAPGTFRPRILNANEHAPLGGPAGQAGFGLTESTIPVPEAYQSPGLDLQPEVVSFIKLPSGSTNATVLMHELGHAFDVFLGPGFPRTFAPACVLGCDVTCDEDTSDEALPLTETIAQMFALWQLQRIGGLEHDDCDVIDAVMTGAGQGSTLVHHPACMVDGDLISQFLRTDDPACLDPEFCDKPTDHETDPAQGGTHLCDSTAGYNVTSLLQVWWNTLHGQYCEPTVPFSCGDLPAVAWPPGCDDPGSTTACATTDELAALPFMYALRTNPLSYEELIDEMASFVACNYGEESYTWFNQALCDHHLRGCGEPLPMSCQSCGNGIREGSEQCDGLDMGGPELGTVPTCEDQGFDGGTLQCDAMTCTYDLSQCVGPGSSSSEGGPEPHDTGSRGDTGDTGNTGSTTSGGDTETTVGQGGMGDPAGCSCRSNGGGGGSSTWLLGAMVGLLRRRRRRFTPAPTSGSTSASRSARTRGLRRLGARGVGVLGLGMLIVSLGCQTPPVVLESNSGGGWAEDGSSTSDAGDESGSASEGQASGQGESESPATWPDESLGRYYDDRSLPLGPPVMVLFGSIENIELRREGLRVTRLSCDGSVETEHYSVSFEGDEVYVRPQDGETAVKWNDVPVAEALVIRPGETCEELHVELIEPLAPYGQPGETWSWQRGATVITDFYGDEGDDDQVCGAERLAEVGTDCE